MADRNFLARTMKRWFGFLAVLAVLALHTLAPSGVPGNWRLRLLIRSKAVKEARRQAEEQLRTRLADVAETYPVRPVLTRAVDMCSRGERILIGFGSKPRGAPALTGHLRITTYFATEVPFDRAVPEIVGRLSPRPRDDAPGPDLSGSGRHRVNGPVPENLEWDVPGDELTVHPLPKDRRILRCEVSEDPAGTTVEQAREAHGPLIAWIVSTTYYTLPRGALRQRWRRRRAADGTEQ
ncbi:hypothetical protein [Kitasatospora sp. NPDC047058]|uniref:hypothetical protein n=1 Tax=Kitasatospora sp. NPDC047058 TaxID=3155620 RepID=UPI0033FA4818